MEFSVSANTKSANTNMAIPIVMPEEEGRAAGDVPTPGQGQGNSGSPGSLFHQLIIELHSLFRQQQQQSTVRGDNLAPAAAASAPRVRAIPANPPPTPEQEIDPNNNLTDFNINAPPQIRRRHPAGVGIPVTSQPHHRTLISLTTIATTTTTCSSTMLTPPPTPPGGLAGNAPGPAGSIFGFDCQEFEFKLSICDVQVIGCQLKKIADSYEKCQEKFAQISYRRKFKSTCKFVLTTGSWPVLAAVCVIGGLTAAGAFGFLLSKSSAN